MASRRNSRPLRQAASAHAPKLAQNSTWSRLGSWWSNKSPVLRFGLTFGGLMALYYAILLIPFFDRLLYAYLSANAWATNALLNSLGQDSNVSGTTLQAASFAITVRRGCDALEPAWFHCAAVLAFPAPFRRKLPGMLIGVAVILSFNLLRIGSLFLIRGYWPTLFATAHLEIWPIFFIFLALALWAGWIVWAGKSDAHRNAPA